MFGNHYSSVAPNHMLQVLNLGRGTEAAVEIVSESSIALVQHFVERSLICINNGDCPLCLQSAPFRGLRYVAGVVHERLYLIRLPGDSDPTKLTAGNRIFLKRARRNNRLAIQYGLFSHDVKVQVNVNQLWKFVLKIYKISVDETFQFDDAKSINGVMQSAFKQLEVAAVRHVQPHSKK